MAKIAAELDHALAQRRTLGTPGCVTPTIIARGDGWTVGDVVCTSGPHDHPFEEQHASHTIAVVLAGSFQYRSSLGSGLMAPGSLMLGNPGQCYECGHEHGEGDRCLSFWFAPDYIEGLAADAGARRATFTMPRVPAVRSFSPLIARAARGLASPGDISWEELGMLLAARTVRLIGGVSPNHHAFLPSVEARVTRAVRLIDRHPDAPLTLRSLAQEAGLSPYHFLRSFERLTGVTPHQYVLRARLREAAVRLIEPGKILDIALDCGFSDVSNFNRAFRAEFGTNPTDYRVNSKALV